jgi:uncharacterized membrane protein
MKKEEIKIIILLLIFLLSIIGLYLNFKFFNISSENFYTHSYTKAICNKTNFCEDYYIICKEKELLFMNPTGAIIQHSEDWRDPRNLNETDNLC